MRDFFLCLMLHLEVIKIDEVLEKMFNEIIDEITMKILETKGNFKGN